MAVASTGRKPSGYRTAVVGRGDVQQLLPLTGSITAVNQAKARFLTAGTVSAVMVRVGQSVAVGQPLATLATVSLHDAVVRATAILAKAKASLETDRASSASPSPSASTPQSPSQSPTPDSGQTLDAAEREASDLLRAADHALAVATASCGGATTPLDPTPAQTTSPSAGPAPSSASEPSVSPSASASSDPQLCAAALRAALAAQERSALAQQAVSRLQRPSSSSPGDPSKASSATPTPTPTPTPSATSAGNNGIDAPKTASAGQITRDRAAVGAAQTALDTANADLAAATLRSPISGTVASIPWTAGGAASTSDAVLILGPGAIDVVVDVPYASIRSVKVGQHATVTSQSGVVSTNGVVSAIGLLPNSSSTSSTTTYPVTVHAPAAAGLVDGGSASVRIVIATVRDVVTVPNSALHASSVTVLSKGKATSTHVVTGARGALVTEVRSGLAAGQTVVLASLSDALPTSSTSDDHDHFDGPTVDFVGPPPPGGGGPMTFVRN